MFYTVFVKRITHWQYVVIAACIVLILFVQLPIKKYATYLYEDVSFKLDPSAELAFRYGERHFSADIDPSAYDVERASYFYSRAHALDSNHPLALQQLARTSFVRGDLSRALSQIKLHIESHPDADPSAFYIRALIYAFLGQYEAASKDFEYYIQVNPSLWSTYNDLAWTKMKSGHLEEALAVVDRGLDRAPENAWLLSTKASILFELDQRESALAVAQRALIASEKVTPEEWVVMYKGNDPRTILDGLQELKDTARINVEKIRESILHTK